MGANTRTLIILSEEEAEAINSRLNFYDTAKVKEGDIVYAQTGNERDSNICLVCDNAHAVSELIVARPKKLSKVLDRAEDEISCDYSKKDVKKLLKTDSIVKAVNVIYDILGEINYDKKASKFSELGITDQVDFITKDGFVTNPESIRVIKLSGYPDFSLIGMEKEEKDALIKDAIDAAREGRALTTEETVSLTNDEYDEEYENDEEYDDDEEMPFL